MTSGMIVFIKELSGTPIRLISPSEQTTDSAVGTKTMTAYCQR